MKFLVLLLSFLFFSCLALAEDTTIIADADEMIKDTPSQTLSLKGNVNVIFQQQHLLCDEAIVYEKTKTIVAKGNVVMQNARTTLRGEKVEFNYETNKGRLYNGVVTSGQVLIEAEVIEKIGENDYVADDAYYTACITCPPSWGFTSTNVKAEIGGYAYITRPWLHLLQFPVLPLPYLVVPLNSQRQTGFLVPKPFTNNSVGLSVEFPFFWAIDKSHDATFSLISYEKRGLQLTNNYRYVINPTSSGEFNAGIIRDRSIPIPQFKNRWFIEYGHLYDLPNNFTQRTKLASTSDREYSKDFFNQFNYLGAPALENNMSLSKSFEDSVLTVEASYYLSQIEPGYTFEGDSSLHRLPEINYNLSDQKLSDDLNLYFSFDAQYLNVVRNDGLAFEHTRSGTACTTDSLDSDGNLTTGGFTTDICFPTELSSGDFVYGAGPNDTPTNNNAYGDLIRTGQRLDLMPRIHAPFWVGDVLDMDPSFGVRYTQYSLGVQSDPSQGYDSYPSRFYTEYGLNTKTYLSRVFDWSDETKIKHNLIPEINVRYIPEIHQTNHNFFGRSTDLKYFRELQPIDDTDIDWRNGGRGVQFDNNDRVIGKQIVRYGMSNTITSRPNYKEKSTSSRTSQYVRNLYFGVFQTYDINEARKGSEARPWQSIDTITQAQYGPITQSITTEFYPYHSRTRWNATTRYRFLGNNHVTLGYNKSYTILAEPPVDDNTRQEFLRLSTGLNFPYLYFFGGIDYNLNAREERNELPFQSWRAAIVLTPPGSCWSINASVAQQLATGQINTSVNMEFIFGD